jgi:hypothetical protein
MWWESHEFNEINEDFINLNGLESPKCETYSSKDLEKIKLEQQAELKVMLDRIWHKKNSSDLL